MLLGLMFFVTPLVSGILLGLNWRRLGRPQWAGFTIALPVALFIAAVGAFAAIIPTASTESMPYMFSLAFILVAAVFGFLLAMALLQNGAYQLWEQTQDIEALAGYPYHLRQAIIVGVAFTGGMSAFMATILIFTSR